MKKIINTKNAVLAALMIVSLAGNYSFAGPKDVFKSIKAGDSALHAAARSGNFEKVKEELVLVDINERNLNGETALMLAFDLDVLKKNRDGSWNYDQLDIVKYLIDNGANVNLKDNKGNTILHRILSHENKRNKQDSITKLSFDQACFVALLMAGADVLAVNNREETILDSFFSVKDGRDWDSKTKIDKSSEYNFLYLSDSINLLLSCLAGKRDSKYSEKLTGYYLMRNYTVGVDFVGKILSLGTYTKVFDGLDFESKADCFRSVRNENLEKYDLANQKIKS